MRKPFIHCFFLGLLGLSACGPATAVRSELGRFESARVILTLRRESKERPEVGEVVTRKEPKACLEILFRTPVLLRSNENVICESFDLESESDSENPTLSLNASSSRERVVLFISPGAQSIEDLTKSAGL